MTILPLNKGPAIPAAAQRFLKYVEASPTPFHATASSVAMLEHAGFVQLHEHQSWDEKLYQRNQSSLVAFVIGKKYAPGHGVHMIGAHTDSPNLRVRPVSKKSKEGYLQCSVETYGGGQWHTWFDRDLSLAGRVIVAADEGPRPFVSRLVHIRRPLLRVPTLAIHLNRSVNEAFKFNQEDQLQPIFGLAESLNQTVPASQAVGSPTMSSKHHPALLELLATELQVPVEAIEDFELSLYDTNPPTAGGLNNEFLFTPRVDNQMSCFCATEALIASLVDIDAVDQAQSIRAIALFDHEEVGSVSHQGAESSLLWSMIHRLAGLTVNGTPESSASAAELIEQSLARSFLISSDTAHGTYGMLTSAVHPNYASVHEEHLRPKINAGPVVKTNAKQRYASNAVTTFLLRRVAKRAGVPLQEFEVRNDCPCGSTIGPMLSKAVRTVDLGNPQLSMHSIREVCGTKDVDYKIRLFMEFFRSFDEIDAELHVD
ncbi:aspartyl aminopeptidase [Malassezia nana]|uniref:aspartyl aminopeptidase n=1 Tax=Malassezia nana TaxID=180528 RepID=A0AAF0J0Z5_9BASI|nr:aspartyl aminopeptidase [Malassezia nana]